MEEQLAGNVSTAPRNAAEIYEKIVVSIIASQELIIGPIAIEKAQNVNGISVDWKQKTVRLSGEPTDLIDELINQYKVLFGQISVQVCRDAAAKFTDQLPDNQLPEMLQ